MKGLSQICHFRYFGQAKRNHTLPLEVFAEHRGILGNILLSQMDICRIRLFGRQISICCMQALSFPAKIKIFSNYHSICVGILQNNV